MSTEEKKTDQVNNKKDLSLSDFGFSLPAILLGLIMAAISVLMIADGTGVMKTDRMGILGGIGAFSSIAPIPPTIWVILIAVGLINPLMKALKIKFRFTPKELIVSSTIASFAWGLADYEMLRFFPQSAVGWWQAVSGHHLAKSYRATLFEPFLKKASPLVHLQSEEAFLKFAEGGYPMDWGAWLLPVLTASLFVLAVICLAISIAVIFRRRWSEHEHLRYPMANIKMSLIEAQYPSSLGEGMIVKSVPLFVNWLFLLGVIFGLLNSSSILARIWPWWPIDGSPLPKISKGWQRLVWGQQPFTAATFGHIANASAEWMSVFWFAETRVLSSIVVWSRVVIPIFLAICFMRGWFGIRDTASTRLHESSIFQLIDDRCIHRMRFPVFFFTMFSGIWMFRGELKRIILTAFSKKNDECIDDSKEAITYRTALILGLVSFLYMIFYGTLFQMNFLWSTVTMLLFFLAPLFVGSRLRCEFGLPGNGSAGWNVTSGFLRPLLGKDLIGDNLVGIGAFTRYGWGRHGRWPAIILEGFSMMDSQSDGGEKRGRRVVIYSALISVIIGLLIMIFVILPSINSVGMINHPTGVQYSSTQWFVSETAANALDWTGIWDFEMEYVYLVVSCGIVIFLATWGMDKFLWWPFHPHGFAISVVESASSWTPALWIWVLKSLVTRYGGSHMYHKLSPLFLGVLTGSSLMQLVGVVINIIKVTVAR